MLRAEKSQSTSLSPEASFVAPHDESSHDIPGAPSADAWSTTHSWARHLAVETAVATFRVGLAAPMALDAVAGPAMGGLANVASFGPKVACGALAGLLSLPLGLRFEDGAAAGAFVGGLASQGVIEGAYRASILTLVGAAAAASIGAGAVVGAAALTASAAGHVGRKALAAAQRPAAPAVP